jgi:flagellar motor switch protein FliN/FliY
MEIQKDFLEDNYMARLQMEILEQEFHPISSLTALPKPPSTTSLPRRRKEEPRKGRWGRQARGRRPPRPQEQPVSVSHVRYMDLDEPSGPLADNVKRNPLRYRIAHHGSTGQKDMKIKEILEMGQGSVIELDKTAGDYVDLIVNGKKFAIGEVMVADENYAVRIVSLVSRRERIMTLGEWT